MDKVPKPKILTLDPNDENIILGIPDDVDPSKITRGTYIKYFFKFSALKLYRLNHKGVTVIS